MIGEAISGILAAPGVVRLGRAGQAFQAAPAAGTAWNFGGALVGVIGPDKVINAVIRYSAHLATRAEGLDAATAADMVLAMQARAPQRTGTLSAGIVALQAGSSWVVEASAQRYGNTADYARMVEFGTAPGERGRRVASDDYYASPYSGRRGSLNDETGRRRRAADARRRVNRTHPGTAPQPYFVPVVAEFTARRALAMESISDAAASAEDLL